MSKGKKIGLWSLAIIGLIVLGVGAFGIAYFGRILKSARGEHTGASGPQSISETISDLRQVALEPKAGFPGQDKLVLLCMGIDDNWTDSDVVFTKGARTDTLFLLTLDLDTHKVTMLSIPRDTYTHIAGTETSTKINSAYSTGGPERSIATVAEMLGVHADHYLVLNIDATKKMVDALGGVDADVEHEMHYHDKWGHLTIDLLPGQQHLAGDQAVGFARYRHPDKGVKPSPEDGDERRMYRQHVLLRAMVAKAKTFANVTQAPHLIDVAMSSIRTDLTRQQLFDLAAIFKGVQPDDIRTASLPGEDFHGPRGEWDYRLYPEKSKAYVDWLVRGDDTAARRLVTVIVKNGTHVSGLAQQAVEQLKEAGYTNIENGGNAPPPAVHLTGAAANTNPPQTQMLDTGVPNPAAPEDIATLLSLSAPIEQRKPVKPNRLGWTPPATVTVTLGQDYAALHKDAGVIEAGNTTAKAGAPL